MHMKLSKLLILFLLFSLKGFSQQYSFNPSPGIYTTISGTIITDINRNDDNSGDIPLGFTFNYNGSPYSSINVSSNGTITFGSSFDGAYHDFNLSYIFGKNIIAPFWTDLESDVKANSSAQFLVEGITGNRKITIQWDKFQKCCNFTRGDELVSFQAILYESTNKIEFRYNKNLGYSTDFIQNATVGLKFFDNVNNDTYLSVNELSRSATVTSTTSNLVNWIDESNTGLVLTFSIPSLAIITPDATLTSNCAGVPSIPKTFGVNGSGLSTPVIILAPSNFEVSTSSSGAYSSSLTLPQASTVSQTVYIRLSSAATTNGANGIITANSSGLTPATTTVSSTTVAAPTFSVTGPFTICSEGTYAVSLTVANSYNGWTTSSNAISVNSSGYVTAGTVSGTYSVSYSDACAQTTSATVTVSSTSTLPAITDGIASYKFNNNPQGPLGSGNVNYVGYNGFNYTSATKPTNTGFYKANNQSGNNAGCPYPFYIFRCTTCPD